MSYYVLIVLNLLNLVTVIHVGRVFLQLIEVYFYLVSICSSFELLSGSELRRRYPQFNVDESVEAFVDPEAGYVDAAQANAVHVALARQHGATVIDNCKASQH